VNSKRVAGLAAVALHTRHTDTTTVRLCAEQVARLGVGVLQAESTGPTGRQPRAEAEQHTLPPPRPRLQGRLSCHRRPMQKSDLCWRSFFSAIKPGGNFREISHAASKLSSRASVNASASMLSYTCSFFCKLQVRGAGRSSDSSLLSPFPRAH
jgi:hypothetical protein